MEILMFGKVFSDQAIGVLIEASIAGTVWASEKDLCVQGFRHFFMV
jgi:hypothetical protein